MKTPLYLPTPNGEERIALDNNLILQTAKGLVKEANEDSIGYFANETLKRICIADGHWGDQASRTAVRYWTDEEREFPTTLSSAISRTQELEEMIYTEFGKPSMNENSDFTPETSFTCIEILDNNVTIISYGDTRLLIANNGTLKYKQATHETWLGAFSYLELRNRMPAEQATTFTKIQLDQNDYIFLFTDGVDQCVYEKDTIPLEKIVELSKQQHLGRIFNTLFQEIFKNGAEDNASLAVFRHSKT